MRSLNALVSRLEPLHGQGVLRLERRGHQRQLLEQSELTHVEEVVHQEAGLGLAPADHSVAEGQGGELVDLS